MKINRCHFLYIVAISAICVYACSLLGQVIDSQEQITSLLKQTVVISLVELVLCLIVWKLYTDSFFSLFIFYLFSYYIFTMGQGILFLFDIEHSFANVYKLVSLDTMLKVHVYTILCIAFLFEGAILAAGKNIVKSEMVDSDNDYDSGIFGQVGVILFWISIIPLIIYLYHVIMAYLAGGYAFAFQSVSNSSGLMRIVTKIYPFAIPALVMIMIGYVGAIRKIAKVLLIIVGLLYFMIGERTGAASILLAVFILQKYLGEKECIDGYRKKDNNFKIVLLIVFFAITIPALGALRNTNDMSLGAIAEQIENAGIFSGITDTIATMGYSSYPLGKTMDIVPEYKNFAYGESYLYALLSIFPNLFGGVHISVEKAGLAQWLMDFLDMNYGPGYSYPAEAWYNFGWCGSVVMLAVGYVFCRFLFLPKGARVSKTTLFISIVFFIETITTPRRELMTAVRLVGYYVFIPVLLVYLLNRRYSGRR